MKKIYLEITNICNLNCSFCHKTSREKRIMTEEEFERITDALRGKGEYLFFHLMGEPLLHPQLPHFICRAREKGFLPCVTTNGTLLGKRGEELAAAEPYKVSISLHAPEANGAFATREYLEGCVWFSRAAAKKNTYTVFRLWNEGGADRGNETILDCLKEEFPGDWMQTRSGWRLADRIFLEMGSKFDWPDPNEKERGNEVFCYGLRDQIGILSDGTVVPCCLDADGNLALGNIFESSIDDILSGERAKRIYNGFTAHTAVENMCRRCGYAAQKQFRK